MKWFVAAWLACGLGCMLSSGAVAQGSSTAFLPGAADARAFGMGGTLQALPRDASAVHWNPGLLVFTDRASLSGGWSRPVEGIAATRGYGLASTPLGAALHIPEQELPVHRWAAGVGFVNQRFDLSQGGGWSETQVGVSVAHALSGYLGMGATLRYLGSTTEVYGANASGFALDLGMAGLIAPQVRGAITLQAFPGTVRWKDLEVTETLPDQLGAAIAVDVPELRAELGVLASNASNAVMYLGLERGLFGESLQLRGGSRFFTGQDPRFVLTAGAGVRAGRVRADFGAQFDAATALGTLEAASLSFDF